MGTYLINRSPTAALKARVTPAECWLKANPNFDKLRIFDVKLLHEHLLKNGKLNSKSREGVMIGYATDTTDRKSFSGYMFQVYGCTVSWSSRKHRTVDGGHLFQRSGIRNIECCSC